MKVGDLVQANKFANWFARQAKIGLVLEIVDPGRGHGTARIRVLLGGKIEGLPTNHFEVIA